MELSPHFSLQEAIYSQTASYMGINNTPNELVLVELIKTAQWAERIRAALGYPMIITSWYRCPALEEAITKVRLDSAEMSQKHHPKGVAIDFICPLFGPPFKVAQFLASRIDELKIGQLCYEYTWIHVSRLAVPNPINRVISGNASGWVPGIVDHK